MKKSALLVLSAFALNTVTPMHVVYGDTSGQPTVTKKSQKRYNKKDDFEFGPLVDLITIPIVIGAFIAALKAHNSEEAANLEEKIKPTIKKIDPVVTELKQKLLPPAKTAPAAAALPPGKTPVAALPKGHNRAAEKLARDLGDLVGELSAKLSSEPDQLLESDMHNVGAVQGFTDKFVSWIQKNGNKVSVRELMEALQAMSKGLEDVPLSPSVSTGAVRVLTDSDKVAILNSKYKLIKAARRQNPNDPEINAIADEATAFMKKTLNLGDKRAMPTDEVPLTPMPKVKDEDIEAFDRLITAKFIDWAAGANNK